MNAGCKIGKNGCMKECMKVLNPSSWQILSNFWALDGTLHAWK